LAFGTKKEDAENRSSTPKWGEYSSCLNENNEESNQTMHGILIDLENIYKNKELRHEFRIPSCKPPSFGENAQGETLLMQEEEMPKKSSRKQQKVSDRYQSHQPHI